MLGLFLYVCGVLACLLSLRRPQIGMYYLVPLLPLQTIRYEMQRFPLGGAMVDLVLIGVMTGMWLRRDGPLFRDLPMKKLLFVFALYLYVQLWHGAITIGGALPISTGNGRVSLWKNFVEMPLMYAIAFIVFKSQKQIKFVVLLMCISGLLVGALFYRDMHVHDFSQYSGEVENARSSGVMGYAGPNGLAAFEAGFALFLIGFCGFKTPGFLKIVVPLALIASTYGVLYTFSRGAYLAMIVGVFFVGVMQKRSLLVFGLAGLLGATVIMPAAVIERISGTFIQAQGSTDSKLEGSAEKRLLILQNAMGIIVHNPVIGIGFDTYQYLHPVANLRDTHDFYLKLAVEEGAVGLVMFLVIFWKMFYMGFDLFRKSHDPFMTHLGMGFAACMVGAVVVNAFGDRWSYPQVDSYWWILLALVSRGRWLDSQAEQSEVPESDLVLETAPA